MSTLSVVTHGFKELEGKIRAEEIRIQGNGLAQSKATHQLEGRAVGEGQPWRVGSEPTEPTQSACAPREVNRNHVDRLGSDLRFNEVDEAHPVPKGMEPGDRLVEDVVRRDRSPVVVVHPAFGVRYRIVARVSCVTQCNVGPGVEEDRPHRLRRRGLAPDE